MALNGKQKAAMLLMSLDASTAAEMLKGLDAKVVQELALELAYIDAAGLKNNNLSFEITQQFYNSLSNEKEFHIDDFLNDLLKATVGVNQAENIHKQIQDLLHKRDPFIPIRSADAQTLTSVLSNEHPQAIALVLSELPAKKSSAVLGLLSEDIRLNAVSRMTSCETITKDAKVRIAETICNNLSAVTTSDAGEISAAQPDQSLRKIAVILRNLGKELRDGLLNAIKEKDNEAGDKVSSLMIIWTDIPEITDRSLQEAMRGIDSRNLALALYKADENIVSKIKSNISERAASALDEETSLMSAPKKEDIENARVEIVQTLHDMNLKGELAFIEE
jgi:flagellar motor switch protein FliG